MKGLNENLPKLATMTVWSTILECNPVTLWRARKSGKLESVRLGNGQVMIGREDIYNWLLSKKDGK